MTHLDLFSGIGGFSKGFEPCGITTIGFCEINPFCQSVLRMNFPKAWIHDDIRTLTVDIIRSYGPLPDIVTAGVPCQPASVAGKRQGSADSRWLWPELLRLVGELRDAGAASWLVAENVPGFIGLEPHGLDWFCDEMEGQGYEVLPVVIGAEHAGAPHKRHRVWIIGSLANAKRNGWREQEPGRGSEERTAISGAGEELDDSAVSRRAGDAGRIAARSVRDEARGTESTGPRCCDFPGGCWRCGNELADAGHGAQSERARGPRRKAGEWAPNLTQNAGDSPLANPFGAGKGPRARGAERDESNGIATQHELTGRDTAIGVDLVNSESTRLEGHRPDAGQPQVAEPWNPGIRWPSRPGQPQHDWEEPRLVKFEVGSDADGLSPDMVRLARRRNKEALKAVGNSVVPHIPYVIGRAIMAAAEVSA